MQLNESGGDRRQKDDVYTPVHKTEEFKKTVKQIKERNTAQAAIDNAYVAKPEPKQPTFNVPLPGSAALPPKKSGPHHSSTSFNKALYDKELEKAVRDNVINEMPKQLPMGVNRDKVKQLIDKEVERRVDLIKTPRYVMLSDGTPFYLNKGDERDELEKSLLGESPLKRRWILAKFDIANGVQKLTSFIGKGATRTKELLTDTSEEGNVAGAIAQLGLNSALLGWQYIRAADYPIFADEEKAKALDQEAEAVKYTNPQQAIELKKKAEDMRKGVQLKQSYMENLHLAERAVDNAWDSLFTEVKESNEFANEHYDPNMVDPKTGRKILPIEQKMMYEKKQRELAAQTATDFRTKATEAYGSGDYEKAIELTKQAQEADRNSTLADPYGAYTWIREPDRYNKFKEDAALLELQKGAPLDAEEIRRLKEYHANSWTELTGEFVFDPVNLIPASVMEKAIGMPLKGLKTANKAVAEAFPIYEKTLHVMGSPVRWLMRESVSSGGNRIARQTYNIMERISNGYVTSEEVTNAIDKISDFVLDAKRAPNEEAARAVFEQARKEVPGLQQVTFKDFKQLLDSADHIDPTQWGKMYSDALTSAEVSLTKTAEESGKAVEDVVSEVSKNRWALEKYSEGFRKAFVDPHRIFKGSRLTDDTVAGWVTKTLRNLSGDEVNEMLKATKFDEFIIKKSEKLGTRVKDTIKASNHFLEASLTFGAAVRDLWATTVLTTFRWPINNLADTSMRSAVYGGNLWDDMVTLFTSTQRTLADELGFSPIEFNQALSRQELNFTETVPHRLLYEGWKPKAGIFSYIGYEYKRLYAEAGEKAITKTKLAEKMFEKMPDGILKKNLLAVFDGMNYRVNVLTALRAMPGGISDFNTAIEFTFRLRMFHKEYFNLLEKLEPKFAERGMEALNPATKEIAKQIWRASEGNPRKMTAYVDNLLGGAKNTPASWSFVVPPEIENILGKGMSVEDRQLFMASVKNELDDFIETSARNGKELSSDDFKNFMADYKTKMQDEIQHRMSMSHDFRDVDGSIRTDGVTNDVLTEDDIQGAMPIPKDENPRTKEVEAAIGKLNRKKRISTIDLHNNFEAAISNYAKVERVPGDGMKLVKKGDGFVVEVGDNLLKKKAGDYYNKINDTVISIFKNQDADLIMHSGFANTDQYETVMREFFADPTEVLNKNERQFLTLVNQMENHPELRAIIEKTSPETVRKYDSALDAYRNIGEYSDVYGFNKRPDQLFMSEAEKIRPMPGSHIAASHEARIAARKIIDLGQSHSSEMGDVVRDFIGQLQVHRQELKQFYAFTYPGPLMRATTEGGRHAGWDLFYRLSEAEFKKEAEIGNTLIELLQKDPEAAKKMMEEASNNFAEFFLKENGITLDWDADRQMIMNIKVQGLDGKARNFTSRRDIANLQIRFFSPQSKKAIEGMEVVKIAKNKALKMRKDLTYALRDTFQLDTAHADAWAKVIDSHAQKWVQETGQPIEKYYERLGFQRVDSSSAKGLGTLEQTRIVKKGAIKRADDGSFMFYGLHQSNFETMVRETGELFFDDLVSMAEHSPQAADDLASLKKFIETKTGKPIRANRLEQLHSDALSEVFSSYVATGHGPHISVKGGFDRMKAWITRTFDAVRDTKIATEIPDDTYRVLDRMFIEAKLQDVPMTNSRTIQLMAKEADLVVQDEDGLLKIINDALAPKADTLAPELKAQREQLAADLQNRLQEQADMRARIADAAGGEDDRLYTATMQAYQGDIRNVDTAAEEAQKALDDFDAIHLPKDKVTYNSLGEVPKDVAARLLGTPDVPLDSKLTQELDAGWQTWKTQRGLAGFPEEALTDIDTFKAYLKQRMSEEWSEASNHYNRLMWEVEQFEDAMLNFHAGDDLKSVMFPRVHEAQMSDGMKTFVRNQQHMISNYEAARTALDKWGEYLGKMATEGHPAQLLGKEEQAALKAWAYGEGSKSKAELVDILLHGNNETEGAIDKVNRVMLDYQHTNVTDQFMKNWFPFWMFPSRSFPFWAETLATHPQLIANYEKIQRLSRSQRYQAGAVTSKGKPLPSLDGYVKIPGTDTWFNPLAPLSFRYLLDIQKSQDDILYAAQSEDDIDPKAFVANEMLNTSQIYGFSVAPWAAWMMKNQFGIPDEVMPRYPLIPEIQLIPRWMVQETIQRLNQVNLFGMKGLGDQIYPEVPWHDYMVERKILENALQQIQTGNMSEADKLKIMSKAQNAIKYKNDELWQQTYKELSNDDATKSIASFFTGMYTKNFGDGEADLLALRNDINLLKSSLNNEFQASVFDLPVDAETGWSNYLKVLDTPEGWVNRLYTDIGWVKNGEGELIRDPQERAKWLAVKISQDEDQQVYYDKMADLQKEFNKRLRALPIGADWEQAKIVYDWYSNERSSLDYLRTFEKVYGTNKPVELIQEDMAKDWFREINALRPNWDIKGGETYQDYQQRVTDWETNLPNIAPLFMRAYMRRTDLTKTLGSLHEDQQFNAGEFFQGLVAMSNKEGLEQWEKKNDDIFDALNKAWKNNYWDGYWHSVIGKDGYEVDLAEKDFYNQHPKPPSADELYQWIVGYYGPDKFTIEEVKKYVDGTDELDIEQRTLQGKDDPVDYKKRQDIWDMLSWIGPGNKNRPVFDQAFVNAGGDPDMLTTWYQESGEAYKTHPEKLQELHDNIQAAIKTLGLKPPAREELVRYVQAQKENDTFKQLVSGELGDGFFDYQDENGVSQQGLYSYYNSLDTKAKKEFRKQHGEEYGVIQDYYDMKQTFQDEHPTWADYYGFDTEPSVSIPENPITGSTFTPPPAHLPTKGPRGGGGGKPQAMPIQGSYSESNTYSSNSSIPKFSIYDRTSTYVSPGLYSLVGNKLAYEITSLFSQGKKISSPGVSFLKSLSSRYPEYSQEINRIIAKGT